MKYDPRYYTLDDPELLDVPLTKLASLSGLTHSRGKQESVLRFYIITTSLTAEAVRLIEAGGLYLNNIPVSGPDRRLQVEDLLEQRIAILRAGKDKHVVLARK